MSIFSPLRSLFGRRSDRTDRRGPLASLTDGQKRTILKLQESEGWSAYLSALDAYVSLRGEALLLPQTENPEFWRGYIAGLRAAAALPEQLRKEEERQDVRERSAERATDDERRRRAVSTYATPAWTGRNGPRL